MIREGSKYKLEDVSKIGDLWVYFKDGGRLPRMRRVNSSGIWLREARFRNVELAESGYHAMTRLVERHKPAWKIAFSKIAHCKEAHENISGGRHCLLYTFSKDTHGGGINSKLVGKPIKHWKNVQYGNEYHLISKKMARLNTLKFLALECFVDQALPLWVRKNRHRLPKGSGLERITINGRDYYFSRTSRYHHANYLELKLLAQPDSSDALYHELTI